MNWLSKIFSIIKGLFTRPGLDRFLEKAMGDARDIVRELADVHDGEDFHEWKDQAWLRLKGLVGDVAGNWESIAISLAFEELKSRGR